MLRYGTWYGMRFGICYCTVNGTIFILYIIVYGTVWFMLRYGIWYGMVYCTVLFMVQYGKCYSMVIGTVYGFLYVTKL